MFISSNYYPFQKSMQSVVFWITFDRNKIETCGFHCLIAKTQTHMFISKIVSKEKSENWFFRGSLENHAGFLVTVIEVYWFFYIFGIRIENWTDSYMFQMFSGTFFSSKNSPLWSRSKSEFHQNAIWTAESRFQVCGMLLETKMINE